MKKRPARKQRPQERNTPGDVRCDFANPTGIFVRDARRRDVIQKIAKSTMDHASGSARGTRAPILTLDQRDAQTTQRGVTGNPRPVNAAAYDGEIKSQIALPPHERKLPGNVRNKLLCVIIVEQPDRHGSAQNQLVVLQVEAGTESG